MKDEYNGVLDSTTEEFYTGEFDSSTMCVCDTLFPPYCQVCRQRTEQKEMLIAKYHEILHSNKALTLLNCLFDMHFIEIDLLERVLEEMPKREKSVHLCEQINCPASLGTGECAEDPDFPLKRRIR